MSEGTLRNSLATPDKIAFIHKRFGNSVKLTTKQHHVTSRDLTGWFVLDTSYLNGTDIAPSNIDDFTILKEYYYNDNNTFVELFTSSTYFESTGIDNYHLEHVFDDTNDYLDNTNNDWIFDYSTRQITIGASNLYSKYVYKGDNYINRISNTLSNMPTGFTNIVTMYVLTDTEQVELPYNSEITVTPTKTLKLMFVNTTSSPLTINMIGSTGKNIVLRVNYNS